MGFLPTLGQGLASGVAVAEGGASIPSMVGAAYGAGAAGTILNATGAAVSGIGNAQQYLFQGQIAGQNAKIMQANAQSQRETGNYEEAISKLRTGQRVAATEASQAASGVDVSTGSALAVRQASAATGAMDAAMIHFNAAKAAYGDEVAARNLKQQAGLYNAAAAGSAMSGLIRGGVSAVGGAQSLADKWRALQRVGANDGGAS